MNYENATAVLQREKDANKPFDTFLQVGRYYETIHHTHTHTHTPRIEVGINELTVSPALPCFWRGTVQRTQQSSRFKGAYITTNLIRPIQRIPRYEMLLTVCFLR